MIYVTDPFALIDSYGKAQSFLIDHFDLFNGIVNPLLPAHCIVFEDNPNVQVVGDNLGDVVNVNLGNIFKEYFTNNIYDDAQFKGYLLYILFHELLHLDQDLEYYYKKYKDNITAIKKIEESCHAMTYFTLKNYEYTLKSTGKPYFIVPSLGNFIHPRTIDKKEEQGYEELIKYIQPFINNFKRITSLEQKALWLIAHGLYGDTEYETFYEVCSNYMGVVIEIIVNGKLFSRGIIKYLNGFVNGKDILDAYRLIILFCKQHHQTKAVYKKYGVPFEGSVQNINCNFYEVKSNDGYNPTLAKYTFEVTGNLTIVNRFDNSTPIRYK